MAFVSLSFRQSHCYDLLMAKAKRLSVFELGGIVELHVQGLSQRAIALREPLHVQLNNINNIFEWKNIYIQYI